MRSFRETYLTENHDHVVWRPGDDASDADVSKRTGISAERLKKMARAFKTTKPV